MLGSVLGGKGSLQNQTVGSWKTSGSPAPGGLVGEMTLDLSWQTVLYHQLPGLGLTGQFHHIWLA